jgi:RNA 2',3'-cyclic 3'-phosphodiesterase
VTSERLRLFIAADLPPDLLEDLHESLAPLRARPEFASARWTVPANQHVTLKFLGWVDSELVDGVVTTLESVASSHEPSTLTIAGLGVFPSERRARVLWVGLEDPAGLLAALAADLEPALAPLGFEAEKRAFTPHLTLARFKPPASIVGVLSEEPRVAEKSFDVDHLALYRSHLHPKGASYEVLGTIPLGARSKGSAARKR